MRQPDVAEHGEEGRRLRRVQEVQLGAGASVTVDLLEVGLTGGLCVLEYFRNFVKIFLRNSYDI